MGIPIIGATLRFLGGGPLVSELVKLDPKAQRYIGLGFLILASCVGAGALWILASIGFLFVNLVR